MTSATAALTGTVVLDLTTLLPGPLATRILAAAGARVIKIERPGGEDMRRVPPRRDGMSVLWSMLNEGKEVVELDLKSHEDRRRLELLLEQANVLVEQFRPGVMAKLGFDWPTLQPRFPQLIYCSITGYGQTGPLASEAGHDLNYLARTGILDMAQPMASGAPAIPPALIADIAGGAYPAVMAILLALLQQRRGEAGRHLDISLSAGLFPLAFWGLAEGSTTGIWPRGGAGLTTGGSPRYALYRTRDDRFLAVAPLEERFWQSFAEAIDLPPSLRNDDRDPEGVRLAVASRIAQRSAADWQEHLSGRDVCVTIVHTLEEAIVHPQFRAMLGDDPNHLRMPLPPGIEAASN